MQRLYNLNYTFIPFVQWRTKSISHLGSPPSARVLAHAAQSLLHDARRQESKSVAGFGLPQPTDSTSRMGDRKPLATVRFELRRGADTESMEGETRRFGDLPAVVDDNTRVLSASALGSKRKGVFSN